MTRTLVGSLLVATGLASPVLAQGRLSIDSVIAWLPPNMETLIVAKGPVGVSDSSKHEPIGFASLLGGIAAFGPTFSRTRSIFQPLRGGHLRFAVEGARAFRQPKGFGFATYDGCHRRCCPLPFEQSAGRAYYARHVGARERRVLQQGPTRCANHDRPATRPRQSRDSILDRIWLARTRIP